MAAILIERSVTCASSAAEMWSFVSDTERLNRAIGLGPLSLEPNDDHTAARYVVERTSAGFPLQYEERPFEWQENRFFHSKRIVRKGAAECLENHFELIHSKDGGCELKIRITVHPRHTWLTPVIRLQAGRAANRVAEEFRLIDEALRNEQRGSFRLPEFKLRQEVLQRGAKQLDEALDESSAPLGQRLVRWLASEPDIEADHIRPLELAERWACDGRELVSVCLTAVGCGLLELRWDLVCPSCQTASERLPRLADLGPDGHCQLCDIRFDLAFDEAVEATFRPAPDLRQVDAGPYCIGGPARTPHVIAQAILPAAGEVALHCPDDPGKYKVFVRGGASAHITVAEGGSNSVRLAFRRDSEPPVSIAAAPGAELVVTQSQALERHVKLERPGRRKHAATAHMVASLPAFRRRFSHEALRPGTALKVGKVALMFTDLTDSTGLYRRIGDAKAYALVGDHFDLIGRVVEAHRGSVVKTMGDAVMAMFEQARDALAAADELHLAMRRFRADRADADGCHLRIGVHEGPCYCVTANGVLDYFGQTVNIAARLEGAAAGGETVVQNSLCQTASEAGWLPPTTAVEVFQADLKGVGRTEAARLRAPKDGALETTS